jgi:acyl-homoserine lactone acylase PvdQ
VSAQRADQPHRHSDTEQSHLCVSVSPWLILLCVLRPLGVLAARDQPQGHKDADTNSHRVPVSLWLLILGVLWPLCVGCRRAAPPSPPLTAQLSGSFETIAVAAPVRIVRDRWGVPHIYAQSQDDLFVAQGLVQAQDRLFQMDLWRRSVQGRLSEVLGPNFIERDAMTRRVQYRGDRDAEWASYGLDTKAIATAFVRGVNAWVALARVRPPEEFVLAGWKPDLWEAEDLLNRTDAFVSSGDAIEEVFRARLVAALGARRVEELFPRGHVADVPPGFDVTMINYVVGDAIREVGTPPFFLGLAAPVRLKADTTYDTDSSVRGVRLPPSREASADRHSLGGGGQPDRRTVHTLPHPSPRYLVHLNAPGWNVIGATAPWLPGVAVGHNDRIAWDAEPFDADTQDVYVERVNPSNPHQVDENGRWVDTDIIKDAIVVRGRAEPFMFEKELTRHGVIIASDRAGHLTFVVRWSGSEPGAAGELGALALDRVASRAEFYASLERWKMPARRFVTIDTGGTRAFRVAALAPIRRGWNGSLPAPGWSGAAEWVGWRVLDASPASTPTAAALVGRLARAQPDRADALLQKLDEAERRRDSPRIQRALIVDALADVMREPGPAPGGAVFTHPLAITDAARRRFNVGPIAPPRADARPFALVFTPADWDRSTAMNAPGQSASPDSPHFADLARRWAAGESIPLVFSDAAVQANADATLTLQPVSKP